MAAVSSTGSGTNSSGNGPVHKGSTPTVEPSTTKGYYTAPDDPERWQSFIQRYAAGELHSFTFPTARSAKSSELAQTGSSQRTLQLHSPGLDEPGLDVDPQMNRQGSTENAPANSVRSPPSPSTPAPVDRLPTEPSRQAESGEPYADQSIGKSNQDPDIPDIGASNLPAEEEHAPLFNQDKVEDVRPQQDLTLQHVKQLNQDQKDAAAADREEREEKRRLSKSTHQEGEKGSGIVREQEDVGDPGPSSAAHRRYRRRPQDAELASRASERAYADSSPSDAEEEPERPPPPRPTRQRTARSRGSRRSRLSRDEAFPIESVLESNTGSSNISHADVEFDPAAEQDRVRDFFIKNGYLPAPRQGRDDTRRRLRVIRRLGLERPDERHRTVVDRFTRLAVSIFKTKCAVVSVIGKDEQIFLSQIGFGDAKSASFEESFCCHSILGGADSCMVVPNAAQDWRFAGNPFVQHGKGAMQFYAGAPLKVGTGPKAAVIGTMCVIDDQPRANFDEEGMRLLQDLAECSVSELELLYNQRSSVEFAKLHQVSVDFLRRSLKHRPNERAGKSSDASQEGGGYGSGIRGGAGLDPESQSSNSASSGQKRRTGADSLQDGSQIDIFDEACAEIRYALGADAVAIVDLSQFHLFYPNFSTSSTAGSTRTGTMTEATFRAGMPEPAGPRRAPGRSTPDPASTLSSDTPTGSSGTDGIPPPAARRSGTSNSMGPHSIQESNRTIRDEPEGYQRSHDGRAARSTYAVRDPLAPSITPQVLYIPTAMHKGGMTRMAKGSDKRRDNVPAADAVDRLSVLGYSSDMDAFAFDFTVTPASKRIIQEFIANHVKASLGLDRSVWYSRDDSEGIAQSITHLMPPGTETSLAMPVFSFDGQVAFAVVACWTDPLYSYPTGALQFIETIAGSLLASVMKEKLHQAERAQLNFAAAASHELRTPLHQINAAAALLRQTLQSALADSPVSSPPLAPQSESNGSMASDVPSSDVSSQSVYLDERFSVPQPRPAAKPLQAVPGTSRMPARILGAEDRADAMSQLEMIEANGLALGQILENIIDTLDIGRVSNMTEEGATAGFPGGLPGAQAANAAGGVDAGIPGATGAPDILGPMMLAKNDNAKGPQDGDESRVDLSRLLEEVVKQTIELENKSRRIAGRESLDKVEIVLEVAPRTRGQWLMATDPGPLIRALSKIIHNACKFTDKGYIHISMQDTTQDVVLPSGYDNSIKLSKVTIDVKDTGCGMTADFMDNKILQPFAKADPFMPGSGLGLSLARRMIDLLGGVLGIDSTYMKGTIVRINIPLHLYSSDNDSDQEEVANSQVRTDEMSRSTKPVRQDGVLLHGWKERGSATRRVGKAIMRQLRSRFCRLVDDPRYASLIVVPGELNNRAIADIANKAKPGVDIIVLNSADRSNIHHHHRRRLLTQDVGSTDTSAASASTSAASLPHVGSSNSLQSLGSSIRSQTGDLANLVPNLNASQVIRLSRPLFPSTIRRIMRPAGRAPNTVETYKSAVVGGQRATDERLAAAADDEASAARRRSLNDEMDVRAGIRDRESDYTDGESRAQVAPDGAVRNYRSNTATSTSYSISGDLSASEAAALRSLSISEDLSGAEAAAMQQHGLSRYMSRPSVGTGPAEAIVGQRSVGYSTDGEVSHPQSMSRSHSQSQISTRPYDSTGWNNKSSSSIDRPHPEQSVQAENTDKASHADSAAEPDMQGQRQRASVDSVATSAEMLVGAKWSSSDGSQHDELSSPPSDGGDGDRVDESAEETGAEASRPAGGASRSPESAQRSEAGPLSPPLARRDDGDNDSRRGRTSLDGLAIENAASHFLPPLRPPMVEHASDPNPLSPIENEVAPSPIADKHQEADAAQRPSLKTTSSLPNVQDGENEPEPQILKVLVVEDNPVNRKIMVTMLKRAACHYAEAVDGNDAVQQFLAFSPHLVLLDINMPGKDGFEASTEMRKIESERGIGQVKKARIVAVTALSSEADKRRGMLECGIDEWKVKPVSMAQLRDDVKAMKIP